MFRLLITYENMLPTNEYMNKDMKAYTNTYTQKYVIGLYFHIESLRFCIQMSETKITEGQFFLLHDYKLKPYL